MMNWLYYLLEANLYLTIFYVAYLLFLQRETYYSLNRYYLLGTTLTAFLLPFLQMGYLHQVLRKEQLESPLMVQVTEVIKEPATLLFYDLMIYCYGCVALFFAFRTTAAIYRIISLYINSKIQKSGSITYVEIEHMEAAFSFFNLLFLDPRLPEQHTILRHEMVHIKQKHSLDILFFEIVRITSWFNPITYFIRRDIKLVHEYIADELTINEEVGKHEYAIFLIRNSFGAADQLASQLFNQSILKRRIHMLDKKRSTGLARLKLLFALPIAIGMLCISTMAFTKDYAVIDLYPENYQAVKHVVQDTAKTKKAIVKRKPVLNTPPKSPAAKNVKFPPPIVVKDAPKKPETKRSVVKFPPPIVKPDNPPASPAKAGSEKKTDNEITITEAKEKSLLLNDGKVVEIPKGKVASYTAKSVTVITENNPNAIKRYGDKAKNGVLELEEGIVTFSAEKATEMQVRGPLPSKKSN